jgi:hypothetical protein
MFMASLLVLADLFRVQDEAHEARYSSHGILFREMSSLSEAEMNAMRPALIGGKLTAVPIEEMADVVVTAPDPYLEPDS